MSSTTFETVTFSCAIRGYQIYRNIWQPKGNFKRYKVTMNQTMITIYLP